MSEIDPIEFGEVRARVVVLEREVAGANKKLDELLEIANRGKGAMWAMTLIAGGVGAGLATLFKRLAS